MSIESKICFLLLYLLIAFVGIYRNVKMSKAKRWGQVHPFMAFGLPATIVMCLIPILQLISIPEPDDKIEY